MGNTLRLKLTLLISSLVCVVLLALYQNNFYKEVTVTKWRELTWDDFQGTVKPFTQYEAGIASNIYLETDSIRSYSAYAGQNNQLSWVRAKNKEWVDGLKHEQYHYNITEIFARKMNEFIEEHPDKDLWAYKRHLATIKRQERQMQAEYDNESDHSINRSKQWLWEYKIDSMLLAHSSEEKLFVDHYSGLSVYFPSSPELQSLVNRNDNVSFRMYQLPKYGMSLSMISFQGVLASQEPLKALLQKSRIQEGNEIISSQLTSNVASWIFYHPKTRKVNFESFHFTNNYTYYAASEYDGFLSDSSVFADISRRFVNSVKVVETSQYWVEKATSAHPTYKQEPSIGGKPGDEDYRCLVFKEDLLNGFYANPIITKSDSLILPYQIMSRPDSLIQEAVLVVGNDVFFSEEESSEHIFKISIKNLPQEPFWGRIGYLLKSDSTAGCYQFYNQSIPIYVGGLENE